MAAIKIDNKGKEWNKTDDECLWKNRDCPYELLASHHGRTVCAIRHRLELLSKTQASKSKFKDILVKRSKRNKQRKQHSQTNDSRNISNTSFRFQHYSDQQSRKRKLEQDHYGYCPNKNKKVKKRRLII